MTHPQPVEAEAVAWRCPSCGVLADTPDREWTAADEWCCPDQLAHQREPLFPLSSLTSRDERIAALEALLVEAVKGLEAANTGLAQVTAFEDDARFVMGNTNFEIVVRCREQVRQTLSTIRACKEGEG